MNPRRREQASKQASTIFTRSLRFHRGRFGRVRERYEKKKDPVNWYLDERGRQSFADYKGALKKHRIFLFSPLSQLRNAFHAAACLSSSLSLALILRSSLWPLWTFSHILQPIRQPSSETRINQSQTSYPHPANTPHNPPA